MSTEKHLDELHPDLQAVFLAAKSVIPGLIITCGYRGQAEQDEAFKSKRSKVQWPNSKHNSAPAKAMDLAIVRAGKIDWNATRNFYFLAGVVKAVAKAKGIAIRWGGDWDSDNDFADQQFNDLPHFEIG